MCKELRCIWLSLVVALVALAALTPGASAEWHSTSEHTIYSAVQSGSVSFGSGSGFASITCSNYTIAATASAKTNTTLPFAPATSGCKDSVGRVIDITTNECKEVLHATTGSGGTYTGTMAIECPAGKTFTTQVTNGSGVVICTVTMGSQTGISGIGFENKASDVVLKYSASNITTSSSGGLFNCGLTDGEHTTGTLNGTMTLTGKNTAGEAATVSASGVPSTFKFTSTYTSKSGARGHTSFTADQTTAYAFTVGGGGPSISCEEVNYEGTSATGEDTAVVVTPSYVGCEDSLGRKADVETNECKYELTPTKEVSPGTYSGTADIECGAKPIEIKSTSAAGEVICTITIGSQNGVGPVHFTNMTETAPTDLTIGFEATNVTNTTTGGSSKCGVSDGTHQGSYQGKSTMNGESCTPADVAVAKE